ncbi:transcriptional regulator with XRE-family HTH domain [Variovorax boronicumulans]|nr:helix-turn-helix domain-containing protein [Variovorax boronicumulans]MDP9993857.1 transcriptional regulator with XRE-family HTH domain [Variovorax boronicumulans]MDQ0036686.1 transcriptional regulator with XRE-family HTH domain [Variovorax boronicumulans]
MQEDGENSDRLFESVSRSFTDAIRRAMRVAAQNEDGELTQLSQTDLAEQSNVGRSTLTKYLRTVATDPAANPTLDVICRLADTLGIPPAFLLMRPKDWSSLATGAVTFAQALPEKRFGELMTRLDAADPKNPPDVAEAAIDFGRGLSTIENDCNANLPKEVRDFRRAAKASTAAVAASIPFGSNGVSKQHLPVLLTFCAIVGTSTARN